jgi:hypothetical protein
MGCAIVHVCGKYLIPAAGQFQWLLLFVLGFVCIHASRGHSNVCVAGT